MKIQLVTKNSMLRHKIAIRRHKVLQQENILHGTDRHDKAKAKIELVSLSNNLLKDAFSTPSNAILMSQCDNWKRFLQRRPCSFYAIKTFAGFFFETDADVNQSFFLRDAITLHNIVF